MTINFAIGKSLSYLLDKTLKYKFLGLQKLLPFGIHSNNDIRKIMHNKNLIIFDVGANIGNTVIDYKSFFPTSTIYCFEPVTYTYELLVENTKKLKSVNCFNFALGNKDEQIEIVLSKNSELNSLLNTSNLRDREVEKIEVKRLDDFCIINEIKQIDLLKIDVEGFEIMVLEGCGTELLKTIKAIYVEVGFVESDRLKTNFRDLDTYLNKSGFTICNFYDNFRWGEHKKWLGFANALYIKK